MSNLQDRVIVKSIDSREDAAFLNRCVQTSGNDIGRYVAGFRDFHGGLAAVKITGVYRTLASSELSDRAEAVTRDDDITILRAYRQARAFDRPVTKK